MNRLQRFERRLSRTFARSKGLLFVLLLLGAQQLLLTHAASHEHTGASLPVCLVCAASAVSSAPPPGPALPERPALLEFRQQPGNVTAAAFTPALASLPRAPPSRT